MRSRQVELVETYAERYNRSVLLAFDRAELSNPKHVVPLRPKSVIPLGFRWLAWSVVVVAWTIALLTTEPVHVAEAVLAPQMLFPASKFLHVSAYALLAVLSGWLQVTFRFRWLLLVFLSLHAAGTEYFQQFVPERIPSLRDVGIDHIGIALGLAVSWKWWWNRGSGEW